MTRTAPPTAKARYSPFGRVVRATGAIALLLVAAVATAPTVAATHNNDGCEQKGMNVECNEFATIKMVNQYEIKGKPVTVNVTTTVHDTMEERGARYIMFSVRHEPERGSSPIALKLEKFNSRYGDVYTTRIDQAVPNEVNVWVHVVDIPENTPITMEVQVSSSDRGAFRLESLVMPFDRGYEPIYNEQGDDLTAYSFTILGVNDATGGGAFLDNFRTPGFTVVPLLAAALAALVLVRRRSS